MSSRFSAGDSERFPLTIAGQNVRDHDEEVGSSESGPASRDKGSQNSEVDRVEASVRTSTALPVGRPGDVGNEWTAMPSTAPICANSTSAIGRRLVLGTATSREPRRGARDSR